MASFSFPALKHFFLHQSGVLVNFFGESINILGGIVLLAVLIGFVSASIRAFYPAFPPSPCLPPFQARQQSVLFKPFIIFALSISVSQILEIVDYYVTDGLTDLRLFAVMASLAQKIAALE